MKTIKFFGIQIDWSFAFWRVKRLTFDLPDWADDTCVTTSDVDGNQIQPTIKYYKGSTRYYIDLPKCKKANDVFITPMYDRKNNCRMSNRKIIVDVYL